MDIFAVAGIIAFIALIACAFTLDRISKQLQRIASLLIKIPEVRQGVLDEADAERAVVEDIKRRKKA